MLGVPFGGALVIVDCRSILCISCDLWVVVIGRRIMQLKIKLAKSLTGGVQ